MARDEDVLQGGAGVEEGGVHSGEDWEGTRSVGVSERRGVVCLRGDTKCVRGVNLHFRLH